MRSTRIEGCFSPHPPLLSLLPLTTLDPWRRQQQISAGASGRTQRGQFLGQRQGVEFVKQIKRVFNRLR